jgi:hypothetical protein
MVSRLKGHGHYVAYRYNPFELEAYTNEHDASYLEKRKSFAWIPCVREYYKCLQQDFENVPRKKKAGY